MRIQLTWRRSLLVAALLSVATTLSCFKDGKESSSAQGPRVLLAGGPNGEVIIDSLAIDPGTPGALYATHYDNATPRNFGVSKSTDGGATWSPTQFMPAAIQPGTPSTLYASDSNGVYKSIDGGETWSATGMSVAPMIDPKVPTTFYAVTSLGLVDVSTDSGETWYQVLVPYYYGPFIDIYDQASYPTPVVSSVAVDRPDSLTPATIYVGQEFYYSYIVSWGSVASVSSDGSDSWWDPWNDQLLWVHAPRLAVDPLTSTTVYGWAGSLLKSTDAGKTWGDITGFAMDYGVTVLAIDPLTPNTLYVGTYDNGVFKSTDGGATWSAVNAGLTDTLLAYGAEIHIIGDLKIDPTTPSTLYAGTTLGVFKSADGGATWAPTGLFQRSILATVSVDPATLTGGNPSTGTVTLAAPAPEGGAVVELSSSNPAAATVPASVTVPAGAKSADFIASTGVVASWTSVKISATFDGVKKQTVLLVEPLVPPVIPPPDTTPPDTSITSAFDGSGAAVPAGGSTLSMAISFAFSGSDNVAVAGFEGRLDGASFAPCTSPVTYSGLALGQHVFEVRAVDTSGNLDATPALFTWTVDAPPETSIVSAKDKDGKSIANGGTTKSSTIKFTFTGSDNAGVAGFECSLDGAAFAPCSSPVKYQNLAKGQHTFKVRAYDNNGHRDPTPATFTWTRK